MSFSVDGSYRTASNYVVKAVQNEIKRGNLKVGDKIPSESELMEKLGVSRSSVREGVIILSTLGILEKKHGQGTYVANKFVDNIFELLGFDAASYKFLDMLQVRNLIECEAIKLACRKMNEKKLKELSELVGRMSIKSEVDENIETDIRFHTLIVEAAENEMLYDYYLMIRKLISETMGVLMCKDEVIRDAINSHKKILESLRTKNVDLCMRAMEGHLNKVDEYAEKYIISEIKATEDNSLTKQ